MRYSKEHKQKTYNKIVEISSKRFRENGFDGVSIGDLMSELNLTHGGFYRHFPDKNSLYAETITFAINEVQDSLANESAEQELTLKGVITAYLSMQHCENVGSGCPVAALSSEIAHQSESVQIVFEQGLQLYMEKFIHLMKGATPDEQKRNFLVLFSGMAGALSTARAITDRTMQELIIDSARNFYIQTYCE